MKFADRTALIDAGCGNSMEKVLANIRSCNVYPREIEFLLLTHCHFDHTDGAKPLWDLTGCKIFAHEHDAKFLEEGAEEVAAATWYGQPLEPFQVDIKLTGARNKIEIGARFIEAIHFPGHPRFCRLSC